VVYFNNNCFYKQVKVAQNNANKNFSPRAMNITTDLSLENKCFKKKKSNQIKFFRLKQKKHWILSRSRIDAKDEKTNKIKCNFKLRDN
jgi:hypothetical protein